MVCQALLLDGAQPGGIHELGALVVRDQMQHRSLNLGQRHPVDIHGAGLYDVVKMLASDILRAVKEV